jgi:hypothetical protein
VDGQKKKFRRDTLNVSWFGHEILSQQIVQGANKLRQWMFESKNGKNPIVSFC